MNEVMEKNCVNGIDLDALAAATARVQDDPANGIVALRVRTEWTGQTRSETTIDSCTLGGERIARRHKIVADEPYELLGTDSAPNPQELLMAAVNACMTVGYVAQAAVRGITLDSCTIETDGELDLRGFLGLDDSIPPGYRKINYVVKLEGDGTPDQFEEIHRA
ncbi:MAG TPA: OsmC family protein, partial [Burkholderiales bacterium]|nr:OsmC family protein [Burkholderiales bacterium]